MGGVITKESIINHAQYLDLVYSHSSTLCDLILDASCLTTDPIRPPTKSHVDDVIGSVQTQHVYPLTSSSGPLASLLVPFQSVSNTKFSPSSNSSSELIQSNLVHLNDLRVRIKIRVNLRNILICGRI